MNNDVITIGSKEVKPQKNVSEIDKQKIAEELVKKNFKTQFLQVYQECHKNKTLDQIIDEINNKKSNLTRSARDFVLLFNKETIVKWICDYDNERKN